MDRKMKLLVIAFLVALAVLGVAWWTNRTSEGDERIDACVEMLGEGARERCEAMEAQRTAGQPS